jgi:beta-phosphoglucomutase family hydrolase
VTPAAAIDRNDVDAVVFDMDGVVTDTASVHARAWKQLFDEVLKRHGQPPFDAGRDYRRYVDGKPRSAGVRDFLASRGIALPEGEPDDAPGRQTIAGLGNRKNEYFLRELREHGAKAYSTTVDLVRRLGENGIGTAIISASRNMDEVLAAAGLSDLFRVRVDGNEAARLGLPGKPDPAVFLEAASRLRAEPGRTAVVEDAIAGVEAGRRGGFRQVIGVDRTGDADGLKQAGATAVVADLGEVEVR